MDFVLGCLTDEISVIVQDNSRSQSKSKAPKNTYSQLW